MNIGQQIKELRKLKNISQEELAKKLNITQQTLSGYEKGRTQITVNALFNICSALNVSVSEVLKDTKPEGDKTQKALELMRQAIELLKEK